MTSDPKPAPQTGRIAGTLHTRGYVHPVPVRDQNLPREKAEERKIPGRDSGQEHRKGE